MTPISVAREIMVVGDEFFSCRQVSVTLQVAKLLLVLCIETDRRIAGRLILGGQPGDVFTLRIAIFDISLEPQILLRFPTTRVMLLEQFPHHGPAHSEMVVVP